MIKLDKESKLKRMDKNKKAIEKKKRTILRFNPEGIYSELCSFKREFLQEGRLMKYSFTCSCKKCRKIKRAEKKKIPIKYLWYYKNYE
jgi:hypothetical protein